MAVPNDMTVVNLNGTFGLDRVHSDPNDPMFKIQGMGWVMRKAVNMASVSLTFHSHIQEGPSGKPVVHVRLEQVATGGISQAESRTCDWVEREFSDLIFGKQIGRFQLIGSLENNDGKVKPNIEVQTQIPGNSAGTEQVKRFLKGEITHDGSPSGGWVPVKADIEGFDQEDGTWLHSWVRSKGGGWTVEQLWGFEKVDGNRVWSRRYVAAKGKEYALCRMVHTYEHE